MNSAIDRNLDYLVPVSFSRLGLMVRSRLNNWDNTHLANMAEQTIAITGPTSGLGKQLALKLDSLGTNLVLIARNQSKLDDLMNSMTNAQQHQTVLCDLLDVGSVIHAAQQLATLSKLDAFVSNAGAIFDSRQEIETPAGRIEATLLSHVLAPMLLQQASLPVLGQSNGGRIISIASGGMYTQAVDLTDLNTAIDYKGPKAYARAKRIQVELTSLRKTEADVTLLATHPGWVATPGLKESLPKFYRFLKPILRTPEQGIDTTLWLLAKPIAELEPGGFYHDRMVRKTSLIPKTKTSSAERKNLEAQVTSLVETMTEA